MAEGKLTREQMRAIMDAAIEEDSRRFADLLSSDALDGYVIGSQEWQEAARRAMGWARPTHADIERWVIEGWFEALLER